MDFAFDAADDAFRQEARSWLEAHLARPCATEGGRAWEQELGRAGWIGLGWDTGTAGYGNRHATLTQQVAWAEEYARTTAPARVGHIGENLLAPTLIAYGTDAQKQRFLPAVARGEELWCQGYSEPGAGSDLAGVRTRAVPDGAGRYIVTGQKIWTSLAQDADWCFVLARTTPGSQRHHGLSFLLVPMDQPGRVEVRPIRQMSGTSEFNEVFFDGALAEEVVGGEGNGWTVAMGLLALERGVSTLVQQIGFAAELDRVVRAAVAGGAVADAVLRDTARPAVGRAEDHALERPAHPGRFRRRGRPERRQAALGRLAQTARRARRGDQGRRRQPSGPDDWSPATPYELDEAQRLFLFTRSDTIYGGSDEIQRNIIAERVLGLPREPR